MLNDRSNTQGLAARMKTVKLLLMMLALVALPTCSYSSARVSLGSGGDDYKDCPFEAYSNSSGKKVFSHVLSYADDEGIFRIVSGTPPSEGDTLEGEFGGFGPRQIRDVSAQTQPIQVDVIFTMPGPTKRF